MEIFAVAKKCQNVLLTTYDRESMPEKSWNRTKTWLGEGPELAVLRMLGLFDRPADEKELEALLKSLAIPGLTNRFR